MFRVGLLLFAGGIGLCMWGWNEWVTARSSTGEAVAIDLADLEQGKKLDNYHLAVGPHLAEAGIEPAARRFNAHGGGRGVLHRKRRSWCGDRSHQVLVHPQESWKIPWVE